MKNKMPTFAPSNHKKIIKMKRLLFVFSLVLLTASLASAQQNEAQQKEAQQKEAQQKEAQQKEAQQKLPVFTVVGESVHDFGKIKEADGTVSHTFKVKNDGKTPLVITQVNPSCGCTSREWTKEPIAPGKTGDIKVTYDPEGRPVPFTKTISVLSNGYTGSYILTIKGEVEPK